MIKTRTLSGDAAVNFGIAALSAAAAAAVLFGYDTPAVRELVDLRGTWLPFIFASALALNAVALVLFGIDNLRDAARERAQADAQSTLG